MDARCLFATLFSALLLCGSATARTAPTESSHLTQPEHHKNANTTSTTTPTAAANTIVNPAQPTAAAAPAAHAQLPAPTKPAAAAPVAAHASKAHKGSAAAVKSANQYGMPGYNGMPMGGYNGMPVGGYNGMPMGGYNGMPVGGVPMGGDNGGRPMGYAVMHTGGVVLDCASMCAGLRKQGAAGACYNNKNTNEYCCSNTGAMVGLLHKKH
jgi:hypothetical protein